MNHEKRIDTPELTSAVAPIAKPVPTPKPWRDWIGWVFFLDLFGGLRLTMKYMFYKTVTMQYPDKEKWKPYPRHRGLHFLRKDDRGVNKCVACELCAKICPCDCITVVPYEDEQGERHPKVFDIDLGRCLYCGLCEDACPVDAIALGSVYEYSTFSSADLVVGVEQLLNTPGKTEQGGQVVEAQLEHDEIMVGVKEKSSSGYHWWDSILRQERK